MPLKKGTSKKVINENTKKLIHEGYPSNQAYAIANLNARKPKKGKRK